MTDLPAPLGSPSKDFVGRISNPSFRRTDYKSVLRRDACMPPLGISRRQMIQALGGGLGSLGLAGLLASAARAASEARGRHFAPRARRVIQLFMNGGPFQ